MKFLAGTKRIPEVEQEVTLYLEQGSDGVMLCARSNSVGRSLLLEFPNKGSIRRMGNVNHGFTFLLDFGGKLVID